MIYTRIYDREMAQLTFIDSGSNKRTPAFIADIHSCVYQIIQIYDLIFHGEIAELRCRIHDIRGVIRFQNEINRSNIKLSEFYLLSYRT